MLLPAVTELLARVAHHPAVDQTLESLRRGANAQSLAGLTDPSKALVAAVAASELRRPILYLFESERRAAAAIEPLQFFIRVLAPVPPPPERLSPRSPPFQPLMHCPGKAWARILAFCKRAPQHCGGWRAARLPWSRHLWPPRF